MKILKTLARDRGFVMREGKREEEKLLKHKKFSLEMLEIIFFF